MPTNTHVDNARAADATIGIAWWNRLSERQRRVALQAADTAIPAAAFDHWRHTAGTEVRHEQH